MKALATLVVLAGAARAEPFRERLRYEAAGGLRLGNLTVGPDSMFAVGFHVGAGVRRDRLWLGGEYMMLGGHVTPAPGGEAAPGDLPHARLHRVGVDVRYSIGTLTSSGIHAAVRGDVWVEAGVGAEVVVPGEGDARHRPDVSVGLGGQFSARLGDRRDRKLGIYYAMKATFAHGDTAGMARAATCAGPCDRATPPLAIDRTVMFDLGVLFGN